MSEKVKPNTYEIADPKHLYFNTKRTDLFDPSCVFDNLNDMLGYT